jgi:cytochrome c-type biogenesis protein CcsB
MNQFELETLLHWAAVALYMGGTVLFVYATLFERPAKSRWALWATAAGLLPHTAALVVRWIAVGHGPYILKYEILSSCALIAIVLLLLLMWRQPKLAPLALVVVPGSIVMMGFGLFSSPEARDLPPTLRSFWLVFHVLFNKLTVGAFLLALASAIVLLRKLKGTPGRLLHQLPQSEVIEAYMIRFVGVGFIFWTTTIVMGAIWANESWGRYWGWDPIETWSLVTWLCLGTLLHTRLFFRLKARATAWGTVVCFGVAILTLFIFPLIMPSIHSTYFQ